MKTKFEQVLNESLQLSEEVKAHLNEAWEEQLSEAKEQASAEMREEFARKYEHDKGALVESMSKFLEDRLRVELGEFAEDKKQLVREKAEYRKKVKVFEKFIVESLAKEIKDLRADRVKSAKSLAVLEGFVIEQLSAEIKSLHEDKKALVEQKVKMVANGKKALREAKREYLTKATTLVEGKINEMLRTEITQYRKDIAAARKNDFGRRIYEAFGTEFMSSFMNEKSEVKKINTKLESMIQETNSLKAQIKEKDALVESANVKLSVATDRIKRDRVMSRLLSPLGKEKQGIMKGLLESVKTDQLEGAFKKYLPSVLNETVVVSKQKETLTEGRVEHKGNRAPTAHNSSDESEVAEIVKLAGIK
jgi:hypothetical protein